jgi:uncharacterized protein (TIGR03437 family)
MKSVGSGVVGKYAPTAILTEVLFDGAQGEFVSLDQCNVRLATSLAGSGEVSIALTVDGKTSNTVKARIK